MVTPNYDQITGVVRAIVPAVTAWLIGHGQGWAGTTWGEIITMVVVTVGACVWSWFNNQSGKIIPSTLSGRHGSS